MLNQTKAHFDPLMLILNIIHAQRHSGNRAGEAVQVLELGQGCWRGQRGTDRAGGPSCPYWGPQNALVLTPGLIPSRRGNMFTQNWLLREQTRSGFCQKAFLESSEFPSLKASSQEGKHVLTKN